MNDVVMNDTRRRLPAEWERQGGIILAWPHELTDWAYMLDEVTACFENIVKAVAPRYKVIIIAPDTKVPEERLKGIDGYRNILFVELPTNDTWARDFGPITVMQGDAPLIVDFKFNGWGLKFAADKDNLLTSRMVEKGVLRGERDNRLGFVLEGGSIESDGKGTLLTTSECLLSPNRNGDLSRQQIEDRLKSILGVDYVLWLDHGALRGDDTDSHIDTLARLAPDDTIVYVGCDDVEDEHYEELAAMKRQLMEFRTCEGNPFNLVELPLPDAIYDEDGERLPATYANFLILNEVILLPVYAQPKKDFLASQILKIAFPEHEVITVDCRALIKQHGSLHCVTMQVPDEILPI